MRSKSRRTQRSSNVDHKLSLKGRVGVIQPHTDIFKLNLFETQLNDQESLIMADHFLENQELAEAELRRTVRGQLLTRCGTEYWIAVHKDECVSCYRHPVMQRVELSMGQFCRDCFKTVKIMTWVNEDKTTEHYLTTFNLMERTNATLFLRYRDILKRLHPEVEEIYYDIDGHKDWTKDNKDLVVHELHRSKTLKIVKLDGVFYLIELNIDDCIKKERVATSAPPVLQKTSMMTVARGEVRKMQESMIPLIGNCKQCKINGRSRQFLCQNSEGELIGACYHEITDGKFIKANFGGYLNVVLQSVKHWPVGDQVKGIIVESNWVRPIRKVPWVNNYLSISQHNIFTNRGEMYLMLKKYERRVGRYQPYLCLKMRT
nr:uncharacterized protein LOC129441954 isoform X2 [Misgurnus anguillicaudatus]